MISEEVTDKFYSFTKVNILDFLSRFLTFIEIEYPKIARYFNGEETIDSNSFELLHNLTVECNHIISLFAINKENFNHYGFWTLLDSVEEAREKLKTIDNLAFYLNSNLDRNTYYQEISTSRRLKQFQSLENFSSEEYKSTEYQDDWVNLALRNSIKEEDYTYEGNIGLSISTQRNNIILRTVLGVLQDELLYGKDISKEFIFEDGDLKTLTPKATINQSIDILVNLGKGDNPQYAELGVSKNLYVGNALAGLSLSTLMRELTEVFGTDDTISSFRIIKIDRVKDALIIDLEINTKYNEIYGKKITL